MSSTLTSVCVYCGSSLGDRPEYAALARELGSLFAREGVRLVYGGGHAGLMGVIADAVLDGGGEVIGVIPELLLERELGHQGLSSLRVVRDMHERKFMMADLAEAFIALPGGWGTLEELTEMVAWSQLGYHDKPVGLLNAAGYFDGLIGFIEHMGAEGFVRGSPHELLLLDSQPASLLARLDEQRRRRASGAQGVLERK